MFYNMHTLKSLGATLAYDAHSESDQKHYTLTLNGVTYAPSNGGCVIERLGKHAEYGADPDITASGLIDLTDENVEFKASEFSIAEDYILKGASRSAFIKYYLMKTPGTHFVLGVFSKTLEEVYFFHLNKTEFREFCWNYGIHGKGGVRYDGKKARGVKLTVKGLLRFMEQVNSKKCK